MFLDLRRRFWIEEKRKLPGLDQVLVGFVKMGEFDGRHIYDPREFYNPDHIHFILIADRMIDDPGEVEQSLLHEMAHLAAEAKLKDGEDSHGQAWTDEMIRLVKLGAVKLE
jgi:hypothetical protein